MRYERKAKVDEMKKRMGNHNITPSIALKHQRNTLVTIDVPPGVSVIDIIIISAQGRRVGTTESDCGSMNTHWWYGYNRTLGRYVREEGKRACLLREEVQDRWTQWRS